ncbi:uncharacterized protein HKW66_Vig0098820 [Vigna angularis]|uniref:Uncharacterized protein n=1 Tax=Phaseolus angularis TaxID=3914 RepID=A0A8T0KKP0_PHAAN|nr:uncharacterized protein HKW66_Vig0098820 [Vigna angularis]
MREPSSVGLEGNDIVSPPSQALPERLRDFGQEDAFALWYELFPEKPDLLIKDIEGCRRRSLSQCRRAVCLRWRREARRIVRDGGKWG